MQKLFQRYREQQQSLESHASTRIKDVLKEIQKEEEFGDEEEEDVLAWPRLRPCFCYNYYDCYYYSYHHYTTLSIITSTARIHPSLFFIATVSYTHLTLPTILLV